MYRSSTQPDIIGLALKSGALVMDFNNLFRVGMQMSSCNRHFVVGYIGIICSLSNDQVSSFFVQEAQKHRNNDIIRSDTSEIIGDEGEGKTP